MRKYTYEDWSEGNVYLRSCHLYAIHGQIINYCDWEDFRSDRDRLLIKQKQKEIFETRKNELFENFKKSFLEHYERSKMKSLFFEKEILTINKIIEIDVEPQVEELFINSNDLYYWDNDELPQGISFGNRWQFLEQELKEIREYIFNICLNGQLYNYVSIHSPNFETDFLKAPTHVTGQALFEYSKWLIDYKLNKTSSTEIEDSKETPNEKEVSDVENNYEKVEKAVLDELKKFENQFNNIDDYNIAVKELINFFLGNDIKISKPLFVKNKNIRKLAFALGRIWLNSTNDVISLEYLNLYIRLFTIFKNQKIDPENIQGSTLYKYSHSLS